MDNPFVEESKKKESTAPKSASQEPMSGTGDPLEKLQNVEPAQKKEISPEEPVEDVNPTPQTEGPDELLIENDGNVFWIFQKVVWSFVKTALVIGAIVLLIWLIWRPMEDPTSKVRKTNTEQVVPQKEKKEIVEKKKVPEKEVSKKIEAPKKTSVKETKKVSELSENYAFKIALWADWMEQTRQVQNEQVLSRSLYWARRVEAYFHLTTADLLTSEDPSQRAQIIDATLLDLRMLLEESKGLLTTLNSELDRASAQSRASESGMLVQDRLLKDSIGILDGDSADKILAEKIRLYQDFVTQTSKITAYYYVLNLVQSQVPIVQDIHDNLMANRQVLIDNVQVVGFPGDQFHRILTPAEWQSVSN